MLFGTWTKDKTFPPGDHRGERPDFRGARLARFLEAVEAIKVLAAEDDMTCAEMAIGALMGHEGVTACIVGARNAAQGAALASLGMPVKARHLEAMDAILAALHQDLAAIGNG
jgi:aryl-alcohol dehydrogenase-like predicted oxidoreductase